MAEQKEQPNVSQVRSMLETLYAESRGDKKDFMSFEVWIKSGEYKKVIEQKKSLASGSSTLPPGNQIQVPVNTNVIPLEVKTSMDETWNRVKTALQQRQPYQLGMHMMIGGLSGTGKSWLGGSAWKFQGAKLPTGRIIPPGWPVYGIDFENKLRPVWEQNWPEQIGEKLLPVNIYAEDPTTEQLDPVAMLHSANKFIYSLRNATQGTLLIDPVTFYTNLVLYSFMKIDLNISWDEFMKPGRQLAPFEYTFKAKVMHELMRKLRNYKINAVYTYQLKDDYETPDPSKPLESVKTGQVPDIQRNTDHWVEFVVLTKLVEDAEGFNRIATVTKSNYEKRRILKNRINFHAPEYTDIINRFLEEYFTASK